MSIIYHFTNELFNFTWLEFLKHTFFYITNLLFDCCCIEMVALVRTECLHRMHTAYCTHRALELLRTLQFIENVKYVWEINGMLSDIFSIGFRSLHFMNGLCLGLFVCFILSLTP